MQRCVVAAWSARTSLFADWHLSAASTLYRMGVDYRASRARRRERLMGPTPWSGDRNIQVENIGVGPGGLIYAQTASPLGRFRLRSAIYVMAVSRRVEAIARTLLANLQPFWRKHPVHWERFTALIQRAPPTA
jgi:hypothetical protein